MNYAIINNIAQYMPVHDNDKIKALCDAYHVPYEAVEEIGINDELLLNLSIDLLEYYERCLDKCYTVIYHDMYILARPKFSLKCIERQLTEVYSYSYLKLFRKLNI